MTSTAAPALPPATLRRARLERRLDEAFGKRLTVVTAGAGFGKSTLLASWCADVATAWHTIAERDRQLPALARAVVGSIGDPLPRVTLPVGPADEAAGDRERADSFAGLFSGLLEQSLEHDLVLVFDDVHELSGGSASARLIESLCRQAPALLHVVVSSRTRLPFPIERLRGRGEVLELTAEDLAFTREEVTALAEQVLGDRGGEAAARLYEATGGWPAAIRLALETVRGAPDALEDTALERLGKPGGALYGYLAEEVFAHDAEAVRELLRKTAPFERFAPGLCAAIGCRDGEALRDLVQRGLVVEHPDRSFSAHGLVREFVTRAWPLAAEEEAEIRRRAAGWLEDVGQYEDALGCLAAAGDTAAIGALLSRRGSAMLARGGAGPVVRYGERVQRAHLDAAAEEVLGEAYTVLGDSRRAIEHLRRAAPGEERLPASVAWRLVAAHHLEDDLEAASAVRARVSGEADPFDHALLLAWSASSEWRRGNFQESLTLAEQALAAAEESGDDRARALAHTARALATEAAGDDPLPHLERALVAAERAGDLFQRARIHNNRGSVQLESGAYEAALRELDAAIQLAELGGFTTTLALATMNRGLCNFCLGRLEEAAADYEGAATFYRRTGSGEAAYAIVGSGDVHRERGDLAQARAAYEQGLTLGERSGDRQALVPALYQLAKVIVDDDPQRALELAERAVGYGWPDPAWALNSRGWIALALGDAAAAAGDAERAGAAARELGDPFGLAESLELAAASSPEPAASARLFEEALAIWRRIGNAVHEAAVELALARHCSGSDAHRAGSRAERRLRRLGVRISATGPAGLLRAIAVRRDAPVAIETLGGFRVLRSGVPVAATAWQSQKARDLLKLLVARRGHATPREAAMEALWPGEDPAKVANRLSVALSTVRSVLDPERRDDPGRFVWAERRSLRLDLTNAVVDVEEFLAEAAEGLELRAAGAGGAAERLEHAFALYRGDFLEEEAYEDWAGSLREEARALYVEVAHALADDSGSEGRHDVAARYSLRILDRDPYDERAHLRLASSFAASGRHGEARRAYRAYSRRMEEIGVESAPFPDAATV